MRRALIAVLALVFSVAAGAQSFSFSGGLARGVPPSVTSIGATHSANIPPSVTSLRSVPLCCTRSGRPFNFGVGFAFRSAPAFFSPIIVPVAVPVLPMVYDYGMDPLVAPEEVTRVERPVNRQPSRYYDDDDDNRYSEHNLDSRRRRAPAAPVAEEPAKPAAAASAPEPPKPQPKTVLIFHDGHKVEIQNYAISGTTLYNLSDSGPHQIALDDLDLAATTKANNERGIVFHLPKRS
jgi:hypothetical protein